MNEKFKKRLERGGAHAKKKTTAQNKTKHNNRNKNRNNNIINNIFF